MSWILPVPLSMAAGVVARLPLAALGRRSTATPRLVAETFAATAIAAGWEERVLLKQRN